jgi:hypothetical protein
LTAQDFFNYALLLNYLSILLALLAGVVKLKALEKDQRLLFSLILLVSVVEISGRILWYFSKNNLFLYHFYSVAEFLLLGLLYKRNLNGLIRPKHMNAVMIAFVSFATLNTLFFQSLKQFNSNVTLVESLLLIIFAVLYFYKMLNDLQYKTLERNPMFWINISVITYFSGALVLFHVANDLIPESLKVRGVIWGVHSLFNIVHYALYALAIWVVPEDEFKKQVDR